MPDETKWEYKLLGEEEPEQLVHQLNAHGTDGWEAVGYAILGKTLSHYVLLKRRPELPPTDVRYRASSRRGV